MDARDLKIGQRVSSGRGRIGRVVVIAGERARVENDARRSRWYNIAELRDLAPSRTVPAEIDEGKKAQLRALNVRLSRFFFG